MRKITLILAITLLTVIGQLNAQIITTVAGTPDVPGWTGDGTAAVTATLNSPAAIAINYKNKNMYIADQANNVIRMVDSNGIITTFAGNNIAGYSGDNGPATAAELNSPIAVALDTAGNLFVADAQNYVVRKIGVNDTITTYAGNGVLGYAATYTGPATSVPFFGVYGVATDNAGNLYISDGNNSVFKVFQVTESITLFGGGSLGYAGDGGIATNAAFNGPLGICVDANNNLYIADQWNNVVRMINSNDSIFTVVGNGVGAGLGSPFGPAGLDSGDGNTATNAALNGPTGVFVDQCNNIYVADYYNNVIREVSGSTNIISTIAGDYPFEGYYGDGGLADSAQLRQPYGVTADDRGNVFIADQANNIIRKVINKNALQLFASPGTTICSGGLSSPGIIFSVTATSKLCNLSLNWYVNNVLVTTGSTFVNDTPVSGDVVYCQMYMNDTTLIVTSLFDTINVIPTETPAVTFTVSPLSDTVCPGTAATFTASGTYTGTSPVFYWYVNGALQDSGITFSYIPLAGQVVNCEMVTNYPCASSSSVLSTPVTMQTYTFVPSVSITSVLGDTLCLGTADTFNTLTTLAGGSPVYQWQVNGINEGSGADTFDYTPNPGDIISCTLVSSAACLVNDTAMSNSLGMIVSSSAIPTDSIMSIGTDTVCSGTLVSFTLRSTTYSGTAPVYDWYVNGALVGTGDTLSYFPADADHVKCIMHSSFACAAVDTAISNTIKVTVTGFVVPADTIMITAGMDTSCSGTPVSFGVTGENAGPSPVYTWIVNSGVVGTGSAYSYNPVNLDTVYCQMISSAPCAIPDTVYSNKIIMYVNPVIAPAISVMVSPGDTVCSGIEVSYTAVVTFGGTAPTISWYKNGIFAASDTTYSYFPANGDTITCQLVSNGVCALPDTVYSIPDVMVVNPVAIPTATITVSPGTTVCAGSVMTFSVTSTFGGTSPVYLWQFDGGYAGTGATYTVAPTGSHNVICKVASNYVCAVPDTGISNDITIHTDTLLTPSVSISAAPGSTICSGTSVTITATPLSAGATPGYQWVINGTDVGISSSYSYHPLTGDQVYCKITSSYLCPTFDTAISDTITFTVDTFVTPVIAISANPGDTICAGTADSFSTTSAFGGTSPTFIWKINGADSATTSSYTYTPSNGDTVSVVMISNANCTTNDTATATAHIVVNVPSVPSVTITAHPGDTICAGMQDTFYSSVSLGGSSPAYQWSVNSFVIAGATNSSYISPAPLTGDIVFCTVISNANCVINDTATSNDITLTVAPMVTPRDSFTVSTGDTICMGTPVDLHGYGVYGGHSPLFIWLVNGVISGSGPTYSFTPTNGDVIQLILHSDRGCTTSDTAQSSSLSITVDNTPSVTITASPDTVLSLGDSVNFTANVNSSSTIVSYQWMINGVAVTGATNSTYATNNFRNNDTVTCTIVTTNPCNDTITSNTQVIINVGVPLVALPGNNLVVAQNPNKGDFIVTGSFNQAVTRVVNYTITDVLGQSVFKQSGNAVNGQVNQEIKLADQLTDGIYLLHINSGDYNQVVHLVIEK